MQELATYLVVPNPSALLRKDFTMYSMDILVLKIQNC